ncbi:MAG: O-acetyl-ADP-ribose deacetylase [Candidatus Schekmanbacteria bacterium]|nr:MAG: O-acetyl-ADP-ribose deacetylase [Candidatus Schekmanbacteria bacterium]
MIAVKKGKTKISLKQGDITKEKTDAIVNAANSSLMGGGGVDGAIHRAGGPAILEECKKIVSRIGRCPVGEAVITGGGKLKAKYVIHTVGPIWHGGNRGEKELLEKCFENCIDLALKNGIKSIAFPAISTGAYRYPIHEAAEVSLGKVLSLAEKNIDIDEIRFVLFSDVVFKVFSDTLKKVAQIKE